MPLNVHVKNFQSIADAEVEVKGFTVVTGSNNSGKTALMRAIRGVFQNTSGHRFVRHGEDKCEVTLSDDKHTVTWEKGKKQKPKYTIDGKELYPGREVPTELECMGVSPIRCNGAEIWPQLAPQFQQIFLLDENGSAIAEALADVERVGKLNRALKRANTDRKQTSGELKVRNKDKVQYENDLLVFAGLDDVISHFETIEEAHKKLEADKEEIEQLQTLLAQYNDAQTELEDLNGVQNIEMPSRQDIIDIATQAKECKEIAQLITEYNEAHAELADLEGGIEAIELPTKESILSINEQRKEIQELMGIQDEYADAQDSLASIETEIADNEAQYAQAVAEVKALLKEAKICPTCGTQCSTHFLDQIGLS